MHIDTFIRSAVGADYAVSKNNAEYEIGLCAARASSIIHFNFESTLSRPSPIMGFKHIPRIPVGADLSRTPPIYRPFASCSAIPLIIARLQTGEAIGSLATQQGLSGDQWHTLEVTTYQAACDRLVSEGKMTRQDADIRMSAIRSYPQTVLDYLVKTDCLGNPPPGIAQTILWYDESVMFLPGPTNTLCTGLLRNVYVQKSARAT